VVESERIGIQALYALGCSRQRAWLLTSRATGRSLTHSRWCVGVAKIEPRRLETDLPGAIADAAYESDATHVVADEVRPFLALAELREKLTPAVAFPSPSAVQIHALDNKATFKALGTAIGLPIAESVVINAEKDVAHHGIRYPIVIKPADSSGGSGVRYCTSEADLETEISKWPSYPQLVERYIQGTDVHLTFLADRGELLAWEIHEPHSSESLRYRACRFFHDDQALKVGRDLAGAIGYTGIANLDFRRDKHGRLWLLECNPRLYLRLGLAAKAGVNFLSLGLDLADGTRPRSPVAAHEGVVYNPLVLPVFLRPSRWRELIKPATVGAAPIGLSDPALVAYLALRWVRRATRSNRVPRKARTASRPS